MDMLRALIGSLGGGVKFFVWFVSTIVIPLTFWFALLQGNQEAARADITRMSDKIKEDEKTAAQNFKEVNKRLDEIVLGIGEIRGELRRIK